MRVADPEQTEEACAALAALSSRGSADLLDTAELSLPITAADVPAAAVRSLDAIGIGIAALEVRTPTLDDVFFTLTGRHVEADVHEPAEMAA